MQPLCTVPYLQHERHDSNCQAFRGHVAGDSSLHRADDAPRARRSRQETVRDARRALQHDAPPPSRKASSSPRVTNYSSARALAVGAPSPTPGEGLGVEDSPGKTPSRNPRIIEQRVTLAEATMLTMEPGRTGSSGGGRAGRPRIDPAPRALARDEHDPPRQPRPSQPGRLQDRRPPGLLVLGDLDPDRPLLPRAAAGRPRGRQAARLAGLPRRAVSARQPAPEVPDRAALLQGHPGVSRASRRTTTRSTSRPDRSGWAPSRRPSRPPSPATPSSTSATSPPSGTSR